MNSMYDDLRAVRDALAGLRSVSSLYASDDGIWPATLAGADQAIATLDHILTALPPHEIEGLKHLLETFPLSISATRRRGTNGLRNVGELIDALSPYLASQPAQGGGGQVERRQQNIMIAGIIAKAMQNAQAIGYYNEYAIADDIQASIQPQPAAIPVQASTSKEENEA